MVIPTSRLIVDANFWIYRDFIYHVAGPVFDADFEIDALIDRRHLQRLFYGSRRIRGCLADQGHQVNR